MWQYNNLNELYHYGILGMHWGRRNPSRSAINRINYKTQKKKIDADWKKTADANSKGKISDEKFEKAADKWAIDRAKAKADYKIEKRNIRGDIKSEARRQRDESSFLERVIYNDATRRRAGKLVVERNMSRDKAISKAKKEAWRNTGLLVVGTIGAMTIASKIK